MPGPSDYQRISTGWGAERQESALTMFSVDGLRAPRVDAAEVHAMLRTVFAVLALTLLAAPAAAQNEGKWGAIAFGAPERKTGTAVDYPSADEARRAAIENCGGACPRSIVFLRTCAAVAQGPTGASGWASNRWRGRSTSRALIECGRTGPGCSVTAWACTTH
jgi:hypothetical protein